MYESLTSEYTVGILLQCVFYIVGKTQYQLHVHVHMYCSIDACGQLQSTVPAAMYCASCSWSSECQLRSRSANHPGMPLMRANSGGECLQGRAAPELLGTTVSSSRGRQPRVPPRVLGQGPRRGAAAQILHACRIMHPIAAVLGENAI